MLLADDKEPVFDQYILPTKGISHFASQSNKLTIVAGQLLYKNKALPSVDLHEGLKRFLNFVKQSEKKVILVAHNNKLFDARILTNAFMSAGLHEEFKEVVAGFSDSLPLFKALLPGRKCYKQEVLVKDTMQISYDAHNGLEDVKALRDLILHHKIRIKQLRKHSFSVEYICKCIEQHRRLTDNLPSLMPLVRNCVVSKLMCRKIADSGLNLDHLKLGFSRGGFAGIKAILSAKVNRKARVTSSKKILSRISLYLSKL